MTLLALAVLRQADARLDAKVHLRLKIASVEEIVATLGEEIHVPMRVSSSLRGQKATILVDDVSAARTMTRLADVMRVAWQREEDGGYRLVLDPAAASREEAFVKAERDLRLKGMEAQLRKLAEAGSVDYEAIHDEYERAEKAVAAAPLSDPNRGALIGRMSALGMATNLDQWLQGRALSRLDANGWQRLMNGEPITASTAPSPGGLALPPSAVGYPRWPGDPGNGPKTARIDVFLRFDPDSGALQSRTDRMSDGGGNMMSRSGAGGSMIDEVPDELEETAFAKELRTWTQPALTGPGSELVPDAKTPERPSEWWSGYYSPSDRLEWLHDATGLPIVAMANRYPSRQPRLTFTGKVADFPKSGSPGDGGYFRMEDGFLMTRPLGFWQARRLEIPESLLRPLEAKLAPTIDDYAAFVAKITDRQAAIASEPSNYLLRVSPYALADGVPALRVWAGLTKAQRETVRAGGAVPYSALGPEARRAFSTAVLDVFAGAWHTGPMAERFSGSAIRSYEGWGVLGQTQGVQASGRSRPEPLGQYARTEGHSIPMEPNTAGIRILLGLTEADAVQYTLPLAGLPKDR